MRANRNGSGADQRRYAMGWRNAERGDAQCCDTCHSLIEVTDTGAADPAPRCRLQEQAWGKRWLDSPPDHVRYAATRRTAVCDEWMFRADDEWLFRASPPPPTLAERKRALRRQTVALLATPEQQAAAQRELDALAAQEVTP